MEQSKPHWWPENDDSDDEPQFGSVYPTNVKDAKAPSTSFEQLLASKTKLDHLKPEKSIKVKSSRQMINSIPPIQRFIILSKTIFGSDRSSRSQNLCVSVRSSGSSLSKALNLHHFGSNFQADFKSLSLLSLGSLFALS